VRWPLGVVDITLSPLDPSAAARRAAEHGFDHIDLIAEWGDEPLALPIGNRMTRHPVSACSMAAAMEGSDWDEAVALYRSCPGMQLEPWSRSICNSNETTMAMLEAVPGLRLLIDTGHFADWGGDPIPLLRYADHVQLRQAAPGRNQLLPEEGDVDFPGVFAELHRLRYCGLLSIEYFDKPMWDWPLEDPFFYAIELAGFLRPMLS
jgi:sugar phosphate isomerase/epimerase